MSSLYLLDDRWYTSIIHPRPWMSQHCWKALGTRLKIRKKVGTVRSFSFPMSLANEVESFLLFSQSIPSQNLGFVDAKATVLELSIGNRDLSIHQSPTILSSNRDGGTTGAGMYFLLVHSPAAEVLSCLEDHPSLCFLGNVFRFPLQARHT